jgi:hypothetical protein
MRLEKRKRFARNPLVPLLLDLVRADTLASVDENGRTFIDSFKKIAADICNLREEVLSKPSEIINGDDIIAAIKEIKPSFDARLEGLKIGAIKKTINTLYDRGEINKKEEALEKVRKWARKKA